MNIFKTVFHQTSAAKLKGNKIVNHSHFTVQFTLKKISLKKIVSFQSVKVRKCNLFALPDWKGKEELPISER